MLVSSCADMDRVREKGWKECDLCSHDSPEVTTAASGAALPSRPVGAGLLITWDKPWVVGKTSRALGDSAGRWLWQGEWLLS